MSNPQDKAELHPLVDEVRLLFERATAREKVAAEAKLTPAELKAVAKKVTACKDDHEALAVDMVAQAICFAENKWTNAAKQMAELAALLLCEEQMADHFSKAPGLRPQAAKAGTKSTIAGLAIPTGKNATKRPKR